LETSEATKRFDARDYVHVMQKRKWFILIVAVTAGLIGGIYAFSSPKRFRAVSWVIVYTQPEVFFWSDGQQRKQSPRLSLATQASLAESNEVAIMTAERLASRASGRRIIVSPEEIASHVSARPMPPDRILIEATHEIEEYAIEFANETAQSFVEHSTDYRRREDRAAVEFLEKQLKIAQDDLDKVLKSKRDKQKNWGMTSADASAVSAANVNRYETELTNSKTELVALNSQIRWLEQELAELEEDPLRQRPEPNPYRANLEAQLQTSMLTLAQLRSRYQPTHPAVQQAELQIQELRSEIEQQPASVIKPQVVTQQAEIDTVANALKTAKQQVASVQARINVLQKLTTTTRAEAIALMEKEHMLARDTYEAGLYQATYEGMLQQLRDRRLMEAAKRGTADVWDRALQATAIEVDPWQSGLFTGMLGLVAGIALALLMEVLDTTINTPDDLVRETGVDFLGLVPLAEIEPYQLVTVAAPRSPSAEAYRTLRANINFATLDETVRTIMVTSAGAGEGKSLTVANLGVVLAQAGTSVVIVDSDLRRPIHYRLFDLQPSAGLTSILMGELSIEEALQDTGVENLRVITSGPLPPNPTELLDSDRMDKFLSDISEYADIAIFDSPPAVMLADALVLASKVDRTILVGEAGQVSRDAFNEMMRLLTRARGTVLGAVLNKMDITRSGYYYYYYYYYYYGYGRDRPTAQPSETEDKGNGDDGYGEGNAGGHMPPESPIRPLTPEQAKRFSSSDQEDEAD